MHIRQTYVIYMGILKRYEDAEQCWSEFSVVRFADKLVPHSSGNQTVAADENT